jgi:hypothetical protein
VVHSRSPSRSPPDAVTGAFSATLTTTALNRSSSRWFETSPCRAVPEGPPPSPTQHRIHKPRPSTSQPPSAFVAHRLRRVSRACQTWLRTRFIKVQGVSRSPERLPRRRLSVLHASVWSRHSSRLSCLLSWRLSCEHRHCARLLRSQLRSRQRAPVRLATRRHQPDLCLTPIPWRSARGQRPFVLPDQRRSGRRRLSRSSSGFGLVLPSDLLPILICTTAASSAPGKLRAIAERTSVLGRGGRVTVSHAYSLGQVDDHEVDRTALALSKANVAIMTNGPAHTMPPVLRLRDYGVRVFAGFDNVRDARWPYGTGDMLERPRSSASDRLCRGCPGPVRLRVAARQPR